VSRQWTQHVLTSDSRRQVPGGVGRLDNINTPSSGVAGEADCSGGGDCGGK